MVGLERLDNTISQKALNPEGLKYMVPAVGIEPTRPQGTRDFESRASTSSTTPASRSGKEQKRYSENYILPVRSCQGKSRKSGGCR